MIASTKTDNRPAAHAAKLKLRTDVIAELGKVRVFEGFCGPKAEGGMSEAWVGADLHVACDQRFEWPDPRRRFVGDVHRVMRAIDLSLFNVFDLDAYGAPWPAMLILLARRKWRPGELGAVILTDGSGRKSKLGTPPGSVADLLGMKQLPPMENSEAIHTACTTAWMERARVDQVKRWIAVSGGAQTMVYSAVVFRGREAIPRPVGDADVVEVPAARTRPASRRQR